MPLATEYISAIQNPSSCFADAELASGQPAANMLGLPLSYSGAFATVYKMDCPGGQSWAVKCFTRPVADLQARYSAISQHLAKNRRRFAVEFEYLAQGIRVKGNWHPVLKMRWVEGHTLNEFLRDRAGNASLLEQLGPLWLRLGAELRDSKMAHGDLQHGNVLLVEASNKSAMVLRLIDYDGMWVPDLAGKPPAEVGHPNYQHPQRLREGGHGPEIDRFAHLTTYVAFRCLASGGAKLFAKHDNGDNLLFRASDFTEPGGSKLWPDLFALPDPGAAGLAAHLLAASLKPLERVPLASELFANGRVAPLPAEDRDLIRERAPALRPKTGLPRGNPKPAESIPEARVVERVAVATASRGGGGSSPVLDALPVIEEDAPTVAAALIETLESETLEQMAARPRPASRPRARPMFPVPDWMLGLGLSPESYVVRFWPVVLGVLLGVPLVALLAYALWPPSRKNVQGPPPRKAALMQILEVRVAGGREADVVVPIDRLEPEAPLRVVLSDLPPGVSALDEGQIPAGEGDAVTMVRLRAAPNARGGRAEATVTLFRGEEKVDERKLALEVVAFVRPELGDVAAIELTQAGTADFTAQVRRNGNPDSLSLSIEPLPKGVSPEVRQGAGDRMALRLTADPDAELAEGRIVTIVLKADGIVADRKSVSLSVRALKGNPGVRLSFPPRVDLRGGARTTLEVRLTRIDYAGPVRVDAERLPAGITADAVDVLAGEETAMLTLRAGPDVGRGEGPAPVIDVVAHIGDRRAGREKAVLVLTPGEVAVVKRPGDGFRPPPSAYVVSVPTGDGLKLAGTFYEAREPKKGPCVLMLPELTPGGRRSGEWSALALTLQKRGCTVLTLDFRGHGENLTSVEAMPAGFFQVPANKTILPQVQQAMRFNGGRLTTVGQLNGGTMFTVPYLPWLAQDVVAARLWLDLKHDAGDANTNDLIVLAEGDSCAVAMVWLATEAVRYREGREKEYESRDLYGAVWLNPRTTLRSQNVAAMKTVQTALASRKTWPPMLTAYDRTGNGARTARTWAATFSQDGKLGGEKGFASRNVFAERTLLAAEDCPKAVTDFVDDLMKDRPMRAWSRRDVEGGAYHWDLGTGRASVAKPARATRPSLAPLNNWGFVPLKIQ